MSPSPAIRSHRSSQIVNLHHHQQQHQQHTRAPLHISPTTPKCERLERSSLVALSSGTRHHRTEADHLQASISNLPKPTSQNYEDPHLLCAVLRNFSVRSGRGRARLRLRLLHDLAIHLLHIVVRGAFLREELRDLRRACGGGRGGQGGAEKVAREDSQVKEKEGMRSWR
jgi:hypothetical protein